MSPKKLIIEIINRIFKLRKGLKEALIDWKLGVNTTYVAAEPDSTNKDSHRLTNLNYWTLEAIKEKIKREIPDPRVFIDFGSGSGRSIFFMSDIFKDKLIGVELNTLAHNLAVDNLKTWKKGSEHPEIEVLNQDAAKYEFSGEEDVIYFFNPFGEVTFNALFDNLTRVMSTSKKDFYIVYVYPFKGHEVVMKRLPVKSFEEITCPQIKVVTYFYHISFK